MTQVFTNRNRRLDKKHRVLFSLVTFPQRNLFMPQDEAGHKYANELREAMRNSWGYLLDIDEIQYKEDALFDCSIGLAIGLGKKIWVIGKKKQVHNPLLQSGHIREYKSIDEWASIMFTIPSATRG